jgi:hypothetical protein
MKTQMPISLIYAWKEVGIKFSTTLVFYNNLDLLIRDALSLGLSAWEEETYTHAPPPPTASHRIVMTHACRVSGMSRAKGTYMPRVLSHVCMLSFFLPHIMENLNTLSKVGMFSCSIRVGMKIWTVHLFNFYVIVRFASTAYNKVAPLPRHMCNTLDCLVPLLSSATHVFHIPSSGVHRKTRQ